MTSGAILYRPRGDATIRPAIETPAFVQSTDIVDKTNGYHLHQEASRVSISGFGNGLTIWKIDRSSESKQAIYFLTKIRKHDGSGPSFRSAGLEIVHAHIDGFFPFRDALYPADFSFERVAAMLDQYAQDKQPLGWPYLDNRKAYAAQNAQAQAERDRSLFRRANFDYDPMEKGGAAVHFPAPNSALYDPKTGIATAADGSTLFSDNATWTTFKDRSGRLPVVSAQWADKGGRNRWIVRMTALRSHRDDYGETRAVMISGFARPTRGGIPVPIDAPGPPPSAADLADLINMSVPIAGLHAGHMIIVADPLEKDPDPHLKVETYRSIRYPNG